MTNSSHLERCLHDARAAAIEAWKAIQPYHRGKFEIYQKEGEGPATEADVAADRVILAYLRERYPESEYGYLTEESHDDGERLSRPWCWIVDPIDGTRDFIAGGPDFAVHIGLAGEVTPGLPLEPLAGVVYQPMAEIIQTAIRGEGAWEEDLRTGKTTRLRVSDREALEEQRVLVTGSRINERLTRALRHLGVKEPLQRGSLGVKAGEIASGKADIYLSTERAPCKEWDACAPHIILREAGGRFTTLSGREIRYNRPNYRVHNGLLASNDRLHAPVLDRLRELRDLWATPENGAGTAAQKPASSRT